MKKLHSLLLISASLVMAACSSTNKAGTSVPDDIYYSSGDQGQPAPAVATYPTTPPAPAQDYSKDASNNDQNVVYEDQVDNTNAQNNSGDYYQDEKGNTYITNNYYNDDYYDYSYSSRLRRFYTPAIGYSYYDPYYTNSYYYDYYPSSWGVSIYSSYNWWAPSYYYSAPFCYGGIGISIGYSPIFTPWYSPWYYDRYYPGSYYHGYYNSYHHGYNHGYNDGYNHGYYDGYYGQGYTPYYYNSYDATSTYYGPRGGSSTNSPRPSGRQSSLSPMSLGEKYQVAKQDGRIKNISSEGIRTGDSKDQNSGDSPSRTKAQPNSPDRNSPVTSPSRSGETQDGNNQNPRQTPANSGEIRTNPEKVGESGRKQDPAISKPSQGDVKPSGTDRKNEPVRNTGTPDVRDTRTPAPSQQEINNGSRTNPVKTPQKNEGEKKSGQPSRSTTPVRTQPSNQTPQRQQEVRPNNKNTIPAPTRKKESDSNNGDNPRQQSSNQSMLENGNNADDSKMSTGKENQYTNPSREKNSTKNISPRQDTRTPILQPRNEPRQYKQENNSSSPQKSTSPVQSRPSQNENKRSSSPRR